MFHCRDDRPDIGLSDSKGEILMFQVFSLFSELEMGTVFSGITTLIAVLVFLEARRIRKVDWLTKSILNWQNFNRMLLDTKYSERWSEIISGDVAWNDLTQSDKMCIYTFLNILVFEYKAKRSGLLARKYVNKSVGDNIRYFSGFWTDLKIHLSQDGWPEDFVSDLSNFMDKHSH